MTTDPDFGPLILGQSQEPVHIDTSGANRLAAARMIEQCRRTVDIVSRDLDPPVYDQSVVLDALRSLVIGSTRARIRVLIRDSARAVGDGHRLVDLARHLSSFIEIRRLGPPHRNFNTAFLVADARGTIVRKLADRHVGIVHFSNVMEAQDLTAIFNEMWAVSEIDPKLRALHL